MQERRREAFGLMRKAEVDYENMVGRANASQFRQWLAGKDLWRRLMYGRVTAIMRWTATVFINELETLPLAFVSNMALVQLSSSTMPRGIMCYAMTLSHLSVLGKRFNYSNGSMIVRSSGIPNHQRLNCWSSRLQMFHRSDMSRILLLVHLTLKSCVYQ